MCLWTIKGRIYSHYIQPYHGDKLVGVTRAVTDDIKYATILLRLIAILENNLSTAMRISITHYLVIAQQLSLGKTDTICHNNSTLIKKPRGKTTWLFTRMIP